MLHHTYNQKGGIGYVLENAPFFQKSDVYNPKNPNYKMFDRTGILLFSLAKEEKPKNDKNPEYEESMNTEDCTYENFTKELNKVFNDYEINTCIRKVHFLAQCYHESAMFRATYEKKPNEENIEGGAFYRGRGLIQLTHDYNYKNFKEAMGDTTALEDFVPRVAKEMKLACQASGYYWKKIGSGKGNINQFADLDDILVVSREVNGHYSKPKGMESRIKYTNLLKNIFDYEKCISKKK